MLTVEALKEYREGSRKRKDALARGGQEANRLKEVLKN